MKACTAGQKHKLNYKIHSKNIKKYYKNKDRDNMLESKVHTHRTLIKCANKSASSEYHT